MEHLEGGRLRVGAAGLDDAPLPGGGHPLQEDAGPSLARVVVDLVAATPSR